MFFVLLLVILIFLFFKKNNLSIKWRTFKEKGARSVTGDFGVYCYNGSQGKGKTYSLTEFVYDNNDIIVFSNYPFHNKVIKSKYIKNIIYYSGFDGLIDIKNKLDNKELDDVIGNCQIVIIYDELFQELMRGDKLNKDVLDFLSQMRKRQIIFLTSAQYWSEIPITFRKFVRYQIDCNFLNFPFLPFSLLVKTFRDGENMKWSNDDQEFIAPIIETTITKVRKSVFNSYDTMYRVSSHQVRLLDEEEEKEKENDNTDLHTTTKANQWSMVKEKKDDEFWFDLRYNDYEK